MIDLEPAAARLRTFSAIALCLVVGCSGGPPGPQVSSTRDLGPLTFLAAIRGRDGGHSARFGNRSVWAFGDTMLNFAAEDGSSWRNSTAGSTSDLDPSDGLPEFSDPVDAKGAPKLLIPFTAEEAAHNATAGAVAWTIWPAALVVDPATGEAVLFYMKHQNFKDAGKSIARWTNPDAAVERPIVAPGTSEPTLLFPAGDFEPSSGGLAVKGELYAYACVKGCRVGRVAFAKALERSAWTFYAGSGRWSATLSDAIAVLDAPGILSVHWNAHAGKYLAIYSAGANIVMRSADAPEGPWSNETFVAKPMAPVGGGDVYDAIAHEELSLDNGRRIYVSYSRGTGAFLSQMRLIEVSLP